MPYILAFLMLFVCGSSATAASKKEMQELERLVRVLAKRPHGDVTIIVRADAETGDIRVSFSKAGEKTRLEVHSKEILNFVRVTRAGAGVERISIQVDVIAIDDAADGILDRTRLSYDEQHAWRGRDRDAMSDNQADYDNVIQVVSGHLRSLIKTHTVTVQKKGRRK